MLVKHDNMEICVAVLLLALCVGQDIPGGVITKRSGDSEGKRFYPTFHFYNKGHDIM